MGWRWPWKGGDDATDALPAGAIRKRVLFGGRVQSVGFRYQATGFARERGVTGWICNLEDGDVLCEAQGSPEAVEAFLGDIQRVSDDPRTFLNAQVKSADACEVEPERGFSIRSA